FVRVPGTAWEVFATISFTAVQEVLIRTISRNTGTRKHMCITLRVSELPHVGDVTAQDRRVRANLNLREQHFRVDRLAGGPSLEEVVRPLLDRGRIRPRIGGVINLGGDVVGSC